MDFGTKSLSHPILRDVVQHAFEPVLVYNNKPVDEALLARFEEPSWNNPVLRFLDADGQDVVPRKDRIWTPAQLADRLNSVLQAVDADVPPLLPLARHELDTEHHRSLVFVMHCYWEGEAQLGALDGVVETRSVWTGPKEAVLVRYHEDVIGRDALIRAARKLDCAQEVLEENAVDRVAKDSDQLYYLRKTPLRWLPLTPAQAARVNGALAARADAAPWLTQHQRELLEAIVTLGEASDTTLNGLERPRELAALAEYTATLERRLLDG